MLQFLSNLLFHVRYRLHTALHTLLDSLLWRYLIWTAIPATFKRLNLHTNTKSPEALKLFTWIYGRTCSGRIQCFSTSSSSLSTACEIFSAKFAISWAVTWDVVMWDICCSSQLHIVYLTLNRLSIKLSQVSQPSNSHKATRELSTITGRWCGQCHWGHITTIIDTAWLSIYATMYSLKTMRGLAPSHLLEMNIKNTMIKSTQLLNHPFH